MVKPYKFLTLRGEFKMYKIMNSNTGSTIVALLTGALIGAGVGLLYAPDKGEETRKKIKKKARKAQEDMEKQLNQTKADMSAKLSEARAKFDTNLESALSSMSYKTEDLIDALESKLEDLKAQNAKLQK